jgi:Bacterial extracellular solute-binding proteins, family 5 Middle
VGTGPYKFVGWAKDGDFVMDADPAYWGQKAALNRVTMRTIPEAGTRVASILAGDVDVVTAMPPDEIDRVNRSGRARAITLPGNRVAFYNIAVRKEPTSNKRFRPRPPLRPGRADPASAPHPRSAGTAVNSILRELRGYSPRPGRRIVRAATSRPGELF